MQKTLRNKALREADRLITCDMNGTPWYCPGGWYATTAPIYDGYRVLKSQRVIDATPNMQPILEAPNMQNQIKATEFKREQEGNKEYLELGTIDELNKRSVNALYFDFLKDVHPDAEVRVTEKSGKYAPVGFYENNNLVAVLMPLARR